MENNKLRELLNQLQDEIKNTQTLDEQGRQLLQGLDADIHSLLEHSEENSIQLQASFIENLKGVVYHFEVTHPTLTVVISRVMDSLSSSGI